MMRLYCLIGIVIFFPTLTGCGSGLPSDPVADYREFIENQFEQAKAANPDFVVDAEYSVDVKKTDSLVSPLLGTCTVGALVPSITDDGALLYSVNLAMTHGYQDGEWVMTVGEATIIGGKVLKQNKARTLGDVGEAMVGRTVKFKSLDEFARPMGTGQ